MVLLAKFLVLALTAAATPILRRDVTTVQNDITKKIGPQLSTLNNDVKGFPASGSTGANTIHGDFEHLVTTVDSTIRDIKSTGSFGTVSGTTIIANLQTLVPKLLETLVDLGLQEPSWEDIQGGKQLVLSDLRSLNAAMDNFMNAVTAAEPLLLKAGSLAVKTQIDGGFATAIAAYIT
ncbi:hypothetical protein F1880_009995 [Penicillium rolfsii]|nr:hypothetical protein F1880_009995 [Penicillium rolfsii]